MLAWPCPPATPMSALRREFRGPMLAVRGPVAWEAPLHRGRPRGLRPAPGRSLRLPVGSGSEPTPGPRGLVCPLGCRTPCGEGPRPPLSGGNVTFKNSAKTVVSLTKVRPRPRPTKTADSQPRLTQPVDRRSRALEPWPCAAHQTFSEYRLCHYLV